jgi:hypothetical protein
MCVPLDEKKIKKVEKIKKKTMVKPNLLTGKKCKVLAHRNNNNIKTDISSHFRFRLHFFPSFSLSSGVNYLPIKIEFETGESFSFFRPVRIKYTHRKIRRTAGDSLPTSHGGCARTASVSSSDSIQQRVHVRT